MLVVGRLVMGLGVGLANLVGFPSLCHHFLHFTIHRYVMCIVFMFAFEIRIDY